MKVIPKSRVTEFIELMADNTYKIRLNAAPERGEANKELIKFLAKELEIPKDEIKIISGQTDRKKLLKITGSSEVNFKKKLQCE